MVTGLVRTRLRRVVSVSAECHRFWAFAGLVKGGVAWGDPAASAMLHEEPAKRVLHKKNGLVLHLDVLLARWHKLLLRVVRNLTIGLDNVEELQLEVWVRLAFFNEEVQGLVS